MQGIKSAWASMIVLIGFLSLSSGALALEGVRNSPLPSTPIAPHMTTNRALAFMKVTWLPSKAACGWRQIN